MVAPVLPARDHGAGLAVAHQLGRPHQGGVLLAAHAPAGSSSMAMTSVQATSSRPGGVADLLGRADQHDRDAVLVGGPAGPGDDLAGGLVAAHGVDGDGQGGQRLGRRTLAPAAQVSRPRRPGAPCTSRSSGRPRGASWTPGSAGTRCAAGGSAARPPAWRLRPFALDVFFFGTAIVGLQRSVRGAAPDGRARPGPGRRLPGDRSTSRLAHRGSRGQRSRSRPRCGSPRTAGTGPAQSVAGTAGPWAARARRRRGPGARGRACRRRSGRAPRRTGSASGPSA